MISLKEKGILLTKAYEDEIEQEANGKYQLSFKYPTSDDRWKAISPGALILADDLHGEQEFRVFEVTKRHGYLYVYAEQVANDLNRYSISSISVDRVTGGVVMSNLAGSIIRSHPFSFYSDIDSRHTFNEKNVSAMSALADGKHSILGQWGGDLVRDKYHISLLKNGGRDSEALFMYQKNLKTYVETDSIKDLVTRLHLSIKNSDVVTTVDSPLLEVYDGRIYELSIEVSDQDVQTVDQLQEYGRDYFAKNLVDIPNNSLEIAVTDNQEYDVRIFDTVFVHHKVFGKDLRMKITSYKFSPMGRKLKSIGFGKIKTSLAQQVSNIATEVAEQSVSVAGQVFEEKLQKEIENADKVIDGKINKVRDEINDGIEQSKAEAEAYADNIKQSIDTEIAQVNQSMQTQAQEHDRQIANILSKTQSVESLANQTKADAASALARANQVKTEAIADARAQVATVSQALNTAKTELQTAIASADQKARDSQASATALRNDLNLQASKILEQARAQTALTNRVSTVETLADGTRSTVAELSKTVSKATGDITSVTNRTKTVEDTLSQTRTQYEALTQTVNAQTGQIDSINRKTADLQSGIDGVTERFDSLQVGGRNYILNSDQFITSGNRQFSLSPDFIKHATGGKNVTVSLDVELDNLTSSGSWDRVGFEISVTLSNNQRLYLGCWRNGTTPQIRTRISATHTIPAGTTITTINYCSLYVQLNGTVSIGRPKVEISTLATDFTLAEEDLRSEIAEYKRTADQNYAGLQSTVSTLDGKVTQNKTEANQTATQLSNRLTSLETYKDGESTRAQAYFEASKTETAKQLTAERTAIANNYVAKSVYDEDARGTTLKLNEIKTTADTAKQNLATYQETVDRKLTELTSSTQTLDGKINTASAKVDTVAGQIRTEIGTVEAKIPNEIGGRNYILKSQAEISSTGKWVSKVFNLSSELLSNL
uniref:phage tail spike protein n=1 Tax=Streptococcus suis TaxID=1307 RepID=UPI0014787824